MPCHSIYIPENQFYDFYQNHKRFIITTQEIINKQGIKRWDSLALHCQYENGAVTGKHISPIFRTITHIDNSSIDSYVILSIKE